jgi:hypothetical protein
MISLYRYSLLPLVSLKQILKMDCPLQQPPKKEFFGILSLRRSLEQARNRKSLGLM